MLIYLKNIIIIINDFCLAADLTQENTAYFIFLFCYIPHFMSWNGIGFFSLKTNKQKSLFKLNFN